MKKAGSRPRGGREFLPISLIKVLITAHGGHLPKSGKLLATYSCGLLNPDAGMSLKVFIIADIHGLAKLARLEIKLCVGGEGRI